MIVTQLLFSVLAASAAARPVTEAAAKRDGSLTCTDDGSQCTFTGCWDETSGASWCTNDSGMTFAPRELLLDSGMDFKKRRVLGMGIPDSVVFTALGNPTLIGDAQYHDRLRMLIAWLAKLSAPHAIEMRDIIDWQVQIEVIPDQGPSLYWGRPAGAGQGKIAFSSMVTGGFELAVGTVAHEAGHAVFDHRGYSDAFTAGLEAAGLGDRDTYGDINGLCNEPTAGILAQRTTWYTGSNYDHPDKTQMWWARLAWGRDVKSLWNSSDDGYWTGKGMKDAAIPKLAQVVQIGHESFLADFKRDYGLQNDPYLMLDENAPL